MKSLKQAIGFGFLTWLLPFVVAVAIFPLKRAGDPLFETVMGLVVTFCAAFFMNLYFLGVNEAFVKEGVLVGVIWMSISLGLDLCLFARGPMQMPFTAYLKDIGLGYLIFPTITVASGWLLHGRAAAVPGKTARFFSLNGDHGPGGRRPTHALKVRADVEVGPPNV